MCDPVAIVAGAGALLSAGGQFYNSRSQAKAIARQQQADQDARDRSRLAQDAERMRQLRLEERSFAEQQRGVEQATPEALTAETNTEAAVRGDEAVAGLDDFTVSRLSGQSLDTDVGRAIGATVNAAAKTAQDRLRALARLGAGSAAFGNLGDTIQAGNARIGTINSGRRASAGVAQQEMNIPAARVTPSSSPLGDILTGVGSLVSAGAGGLSGSVDGLGMVNGKFDPSVAAGDLFYSRPYGAVPLPVPRPA